MPPSVMSRAARSGGQDLPQALRRTRDRGPLAALHLPALHLPALPVLILGVSHETTARAAGWAASVVLLSLVVAWWRFGRTFRARPVDVETSARVLDATAEGIYGIDGDGIITFVNAALTRAVGRDRDGLLGRHHHSALQHGRPDGAAYAPDDCRVCDAVTAADRTQIADDTFARADGGSFPVELSASPMARDGRRVGTVVSFRDLTERTALTRRALHDPLTGLPNRALFVDLLGRAIARQERHGGMLGVLFIDLDRFKVTNDLLGHAAGDQLLIEASGRLRAALRDHDTVARFGGDEFVVLCDDLTDEGQVVSIAERIVESLSAAYVVAGQEIFSSASVGLTLARRDPDGIRHDPETLLTDAGSAMTLVKDGGRNGYELFDQQMRQRAQSRLEIERDLRRALVQQDLEVHYQPKVDLTDGAIIGVEALARWQHPTRGMVPPIEFIPVAEETGLICDLGLQVLEIACRQSQVWRDARPEWEHLLISVNLSGRQLQQPALAAQVGAVLARTGVTPSRVILEITESVLMTDIHLAVEALEALKAIGVQIAVDDFGTGYSSLAYLTRFPVDILKVDRSFVDRITEGGQSRSIVSAVVGLAKALGLHTVAEGVESLEQITALQELGCELAQGFHLARPMPAADLQVILADGVPWGTPVTATVGVELG